MPRGLGREPSSRPHVDLAVRPPAVARPVCRSAGAPPLSMAAENTTQILQENDTCWRVARCGRARVLLDAADRSEEHTSELQSLMRTSYAVFCLKQTNLTTDTSIQLDIIKHIQTLNQR